MALPSKNQQVAQVMKFLDAERNEGRDLKGIATEIVDGYLDLITPPAPAIPLREGMLIKSLISAKVHRVAWMGEHHLWVVPEAGNYGWYGSLDKPFWSYCEEYRPKRRVEIDGKGKMLEMTDEDIAEAWDNPDWRVGDKVSQRQREHTFEVIATGPTCVLMEAQDGTHVVDSNKNLELYYKRESKLGSEW